MMNDVCLSSLESTVNSEIKKVEKWLWNNKLTLNLSKTTFMIVSPMNKQLGWPTNFEVKFSNSSDGRVVWSVVCLLSCRLGFDSESGQTNDFKIGIHSFPA